MTEKKQLSGDVLKALASKTAEYNYEGYTFSIRKMTVKEATELENSEDNLIPFLASTLVNPKLSVEELEATPATFLKALSDAFIALNKIEMDDAEKN